MPRTWSRPFSIVRDHVPRSWLGAFLAAFLLYAAVLAGVIVWLAINGEATIQCRIAQSPSVTVQVEKPALPPASYTVPRADEPPAPASDTPVADDAPLLPVVGTPPEKPVDAVPVTHAPEAAHDDKPEVKAVTLPVAPAAATMPTPTPETTAPAMPEPVAAIAPAPETPTPPVVAASAVGWQAQSRLFDKADKRPRIAIIVTGLGLSNGGTRTAVQTLPANVTLAFQTVAPGITDWAAQARLSGHEVLLAVPMEPQHYPQNDPGPQTLLTGLPTTANMQRLTWALARSTQIIGVIPAQGEAFVGNEKALAPVLDVIKDRQLVFVDGTVGVQSAADNMTTAGHVPFAKADLVIDATANRTAVDQALADLETLARKNGQAVGVALPYPVTFERLNEWLKTLPAKGLVLAPISALLANAEPQASEVKAVVAPSLSLVQPVMKPSTPPVLRSTQSAPTPAKSYGTIPRPKDDLSAITPH